MTELDNNAADRVLRPIALGRKNFFSAGSENGGKSAAMANTLIETAKLNGIDQRAWLTDVLANIADTKITHLDALIPWSLAQRAGAPLVGRVRRTLTSLQRVAADL